MMRHLRLLLILCLVATAEPSVYAKAFGTITSTSDVSVASSSSPTPGSTINLDASTANLFTWTAGENETINITAGQQAGRVITFMITNDAIARTITLGTGIVSTGVIVGTGLKTAVVVLQSNGTNFLELVELWDYDTRRLHGRPHD